MDRGSALSVVLAVVSFIASGLAFALAPGVMPEPGHQVTAAAAQMAALTNLSVPGLTAIPSPGDYGIDLALQFVRPQQVMMWLLLICVWAVLALHACRVWRVWRGGGRAPAAAGTRAFVAADHATLSLALLFGAAWPWVSRDHPVTGFLIVAAMFALVLTIALRGQREGRRIRYPQTIGFFAGWATAVTYAAFAALVTRHLGIPPVAAVSTAMLLCTAAGVIVQLRLAGATSYSVAIIWSLVGLAAATMTSDPTISMVAILGIAAMAIVLVRVAS